MDAAGRAGSMTIIARWCGKAGRGLRELGRMTEGREAVRRRQSDFASAENENARGKLAHFNSK